MDDIDPCQLCGSQSYRKDSNGFLVCQNGHQVEGYWEEQDEFDPSYGGLRRLTRHSQNSVPARAQSQPPAQDPCLIQLGDVDGMAFLRVFQKILKAQVAALKTLCYYMPNGFEETVRGVWCMYVTGTGVEYSEEQVTNISSQQIEVEAVLREPLKHLEGIITTNPYKRLPKLPLSLAILYLSCLHCKIPLLLSELLLWASKGHIPYITTISILTEEEQGSLSQQRLRRLEHSDLPTLKHVYSVAARLAGFLSQSQHCPLPIVEPIVVVWKALDRFSLPADLYPVCMRLLKEWGPRLDYRVCLFLNRRLPSPEISIFAAVIFLAKLLYGLDEPVSNRRSKYYHMLTAKHNLPAYSELLKQWDERLSELKTDFLRNGRSVFYWQDYDRLVSDSLLNRPQSDHPDDIFNKVPDLERLLSKINMPFAIKKKSSLSGLHKNSSFSVDLEFEHAVRGTMAKHFSVHGRHPESLPRPFRTLLELAALNLGVDFEEMYRAYFYLFKQ